jgi:hypothetical protein
MGDWMLVDVIHGSYDAILELLFGFQHGRGAGAACKLGKEALDQVQPGPCLGVKANSKRPAACWASQAFVSLQMCAERLSRINLIVVRAG